MIRRFLERRATGRWRRHDTDAGPESSGVSVARRNEIAEELIAAAEAPAVDRQVGVVPDLFPERAGIPELSASELTGDHIASALLTHGSMIVRGLFDVAEIGRVRAHLHGDPLRIFALPVEPEIDDMVTTLAEAYARSGLLQAATEYLGEPPLAAAHRIVVRRTSPGTSGLAWHQDAQFFDGEIGALNVWTALDDCGVDRPSLNFVPRRVGTVLHPGQTDLAADPVIEAEVERLLAGEPFVEPVLTAGDVLLFDEMTVHRTGSRPWSAPHRDIAITWFFAPSRFPPGPLPLAL